MMNYLRNPLILIFLAGSIQSVAQSYRIPIIEFSSVVENINDNWKLYPETSNWGREVDLPMFYAWYTSGFPDFDGKYWRIFKDAKEACYERVFHVPASMSGKRIFIRFEAVNYLCHVYINGNFAGSHEGGYVPFEIDITPFVIVPSENNVIKVEIEADGSRLFKGDSEFKKTNWPQGWYGSRYSLGIYEDVHIIARPQVYVSDAFIKTSHREQKVTAIVSIANASDIEQTYNFTANIKDDQLSVIDFGIQTVTIPAEDTLVVTVESLWSNPRYWMPEDPYFYYFHSCLIKNGIEAFHRSDRFGFREFYIDGNKFALNGIRYNLLGDKIVIHSEKPQYEFYYPEPESWAAIVDSLLGLHINNISFHQEPPRSWMLDICDEKGMTVVDESALYARFFVRSNYCYRNTDKWMKEWVIRDRNHPSVIMWTLSNEAKLLGLYSLDDLVGIGDIVNQTDGTRPYFYGGEASLRGYADILSHYYIFGNPVAAHDVKFNHFDLIESGYINEGLFYDSTKPVSYGEFDLYKAHDQNKPTIETWNRLQNIQIRHARMVGLPDIRPYRLDWAWHPSREFFKIYDYWEPDAADIQKLKNSLNPMAVFDKNYYNYRFNYLKNRGVDTCNEGDQFNLTIVAFNDEFEGETVDIQWRTLVDDQERTSEGFTETIPLGGSVEKEITVIVPNVIADQNFELELCSYKNGSLKFAERYPYKVKNTGNSSNKPAMVTGLSAQINGSALALDWDPVMQDIYGNNMSVESYALFYSSDFLFDTGVDSITNINNTDYNHSIPDIIGKAEKYLYYKIQAMSYEGLRSDLSDEIVGVCNYPLYTTSKTNLNAIAFPYPVADLNTSQDILDLLPDATSVIDWNEEFQRFDQYVPEIPLTSFSISAGQAYYVNVNNSSVYTLAGFPLELQFNLYSHQSQHNTSWNDIIVPLDHTHIEKASDLYQSVENCNGVARWVTQSESRDQFIEQYHSESGLNNFDILPGMVYKVHVSQNTGWPDPVFSESNKITKQHVLSERRFSPHLAAGKLENIDLKSNEIYGIAYLSYDDTHSLDTNSPGFNIQGKHWAIQCASFQCGWQKGDTLTVHFYDQHGTPLTGKMMIPLSLWPVDDVENTGIVLPQNGPDQFELLQNYPNPFNGETRIAYRITEMSHIIIDIYNVKGQKIFNLENTIKNPGAYFKNWHGKDMQGHDVGSGLYIVQLRAGGAVAQQRILLIR